MTQEDKQILLVALCGYLPNGIKVLTTCDNQSIVCELDSIMTSRKNKEKVFVGLSLPDDSIMTGIEMVKPYLRPMFSMTEEEKKEVEEITRYNFHVTDEGDIVSNDWRDGSVFTSHYDAMIIIDWLNAHHFDYVGFIEKGLALEAPEGMYN